MILQVLANRKLEIRGKNYLPGDPVDVRELSDQKVGQLLNQRILKPAFDTGKSTVEDDPTL